MRVTMQRTLGAHFQMNFAWEKCIQILDEKGKQAEIVQD